MPVAPATPNIPPGYKIGCTWTPQGGAEITVYVLGIDETDKADLHDITHSGSGGVQGMIGGIFRRSGQITLNYDLANKNSSAALGFIPRARGVFKEYTDLAGTPTAVDTVPVIIESVNRKTVVNDKGTVTLTYQLDGTAGTLVLAT
jgi:hypothetical protein